MIGGVGISLVLLAALGFIRRYKRFVSVRAGQYAAFLELLTGLKRYVSTTAASVDKYMCSVSSPVLRELGFLDAYTACAQLHGAYLAVKDRLYISREASELLEGYFLAFGKGYLDAELRSLEECISELRSISAAVSEESERSVKVISVFAVAIAVGIVIILV